MPEFNLVDQPWIPCLMLETGEARDLSLRETLTEAHRVRELFDDSPLVTVALHRFLLAVLHACFRGPRDFDEWKSLWANKRWDEAKLNQYLGDWKHRFDLFDAERPFYQVPPMKKEATDGEDEAVKFNPVTMLAHEMASANNATLWDHSFDTAATGLTASEAARQLIAHQAFCIRGGNSRPFNLSDGPLVKGYLVMIDGDNLFETLALNQKTYTHERPVVWRSGALDAPAWEQDIPDTPNKEGALPRGYLDYLTWQSRRIHLVAEPDTSANRAVVRRCQRLQNLKLPNKLLLRDPFKCQDKNFKAREINPNRALWRDCHTLLQQGADQSRDVDILNQLAEVELAREYGEIEANHKYAFSIYGLSNDDASVAMWSRERLLLPLSYLTSGDLVEALGYALDLAEAVAKNLTDSVKTLARMLVGDEDAGELTRSFGAESLYWSRLETPFKRLVVVLPNQNREDEYEWARWVERTAWDALNQVTAGLSGSARDFKAITAAEAAFNQSLGKTRRKFSHLFPQTQTAGGQL